MQSCCSDIHASCRHSVVIPARNEGRALGEILARLRNILPDAEIVVVDDGSTDDTAAICTREGVTLVSHPYPMGNGAAVKSGARVAGGEVLIFMDADGQHQPEDIPALLATFDSGYDMVVGARRSSSHAGMHRAVANDIFSRLAGWMVGHRVADLTSGFRVVKAEKFKRFLHLLPNGFSYPTTITMSFFRAGYAVGYVPIHAPKRIGKSHIQPMRDGLRFLLIIFKIGALYSPLKLFLPFSLFFFSLGLGYYLYSFLTVHRFTNMSALLLSTSVLIFLIGIVSEQITMLIYKDSER